MKILSNNTQTDVSSYLFSFLYSGYSQYGIYNGKHHVRLDVINMNGRLYEPLLGRFLSPDPLIQATGNTQSFKRYSYCLNSPLKYSDPIGYLWGISIDWGSGNFFCQIVDADLYLVN